MNDVKIIYKLYKCWKNFVFPFVKNFTVYIM